MTTVMLPLVDMSGPRCRNAAGILVVYDITDRTSFERATRWLDELPNTMPSEAVLVLVGALMRFFCS